MGSFLFGEKATDCQLVAEKREPWRYIFEKNRHPAKQVREDQFLK